MITSMLLGIALQAATPACECAIPDPTPIIGHRGAGASTEENAYPENTLPGIERGFELGADYVEIDVQLSADGQVVLHHDFTLDDTTNLTGCVADYTYATLATADATKGSAATTPAGIPLLKDALAIVKKHGKKMNVEIKVTGGGECPATDIPALIGATIDVVEGAGMTDDVLFSSFSFEALEESKRVAPSIPVGFLTAEGGDLLVTQAEEAKAAGFEAINPIFFVVSQSLETLEAVKQTGLMVIPWTVNDEKEMRTLLEAGVDGLITDDIAAALEVRESIDYECDCPSTATDSEDTGGCSSSNATAWWPALVMVGSLLLVRRLNFARAKK